jgi:hypothetical protein
MLVVDQVFAYAAGGAIGFVDEGFAYPLARRDWSRSNCIASSIVDIERYFSGCPACNSEFRCRAS